MIRYDCGNKCCFFPMKGLLCMQAPDADNTYVIESKSGAEMARLIEQNKLLTQAMGGLFPEQPDLSGVERVLDIACGPGEWALEVAFQYPDKYVLGIDIDETMIGYARAGARVQHLENARFEVMNARQPLDIDDGEFDLVNARTIIGFMDTATWPVFLTECKRVLRPGGIIRLTEAEGGTTNSPALQRLYGYLFHALAVQGRTFSHDGRSMGIAHMMGKLLRDAGFERIERRPFLLDSSYGSPLHDGYYKDFEIMFTLLRPYLIHEGIANEQDYDRDYNAMLIEMMDKDFTGVGFGLTAWARKPA
jgi:ubiquinone/menaquinone biosynthesis C-methylase UbiE